MTREEAKDVFLNRGYVKVNGGEIFDGDKWRESIIVISEWLKEQETVLDKIYADIQRLRGCSCSCSDGIIDDVEDILDKYKAESEE